MTLAILSALAQEQHGLTDRLADASCVQLAGRSFHSGTIEGLPVVLALSGIGKVAAATTATLLIQRFGAQRIVFTGVAGGLHGDVKVGDIVIADALLQHDMDASPLFPRFEVPLTGRSRFDTDAALTEALHAAAAQWCAESAPLTDADVRSRFALTEMAVHRGLLIAGDRFISTAAESQALRALLPDALAVDMESAAVAQVCADFGLPFAAMRSVSDRADDLAHTDFPAFLDQVASTVALGVITGLIKTLSKR